MHTITFLQTVLSDSGHYCLFASKRTEQQPVQKFYESVEDLIDEAERFDGQGYDVYFALATFREPGSRRVDNIAQLQSLFLDLDCGPGKDFSSKGEAVRALRKFCTRFKLPRPFILSSGYGVHVYWAFTEAFPYDDWFPVADHLKRLCADNKFAADPAVTSDGARILRGPDTHNYKKTTGVPVGLLAGGDLSEPVDFDTFSELLGRDLIPVPAAREERSALMDNLIGNFKYSFRDILLKIKDGKGCAQLRSIIKDQETMVEPLWRAGLSIAKFCEDSVEASQIISRNHPEYSPEETTYKVSLIKGPYTCAKFDEFNEGVCGDCPHWGKIKSPIALGRNVRTAEVDEETGLYTESGPVEDEYAIPKYPAPYVRGANGGIYIRQRDDDGEIQERQIYHNDLYVVKRVLDAEVGESVVLRLHLPQDGVREFTLPISAVTSREELRRALASQGVAVLRIDDLMAYTTNWINELQATGVAEEAYKQLGWTDDSLSAFVLGSQKVMRDSIEFNPPSVQTMGLFPMFEPKGTLEDWKKNIKLWDDDRFLLQQFAMGISFGSPLMELMNVKCAAIHFHNDDSGTGKTAMLLAINGVWGHPEQLMLTKDDTLSYKMNRAEVYHNIPVAVDEITNMSPKEASDMVYQFSGGKQRGRMSPNSNVERYTGAPWQTLAVFTGNNSIIENISLDKLAAKAEAQRVLECKVDRIFDEVKDKNITDKFERGLYDNYGLVGPIYLQHLMQNLDAYRKLLATVQQRVDNHGGLTAENRFWSSAITACMTGLIIAKKAGLISFDPKRVFSWVMSDLIPQNKSNIQGMSRSVLDVMNDFFTENISYILQIKSTLDNRSVHGNGLDELVIPEQIARGKLIARYETDTKLFYVKPKPLKEWCGSLQVNYAHLINEVIKHCEGKRGKVRLTKGTNLQLPSSDVIIMKFDAESIDANANTPNVRSAS